MGYGLVAIPKQLWRTASIRGKERLLQHRAGVQAEKTLAARRFVPSTSFILHDFCLCLLYSILCKQILFRSINCKDMLRLPERALNGFLRYCKACLSIIEGE